MIKVSVIVPIYNAEKYIKKCVNSIINQTLKEIEIILVDDGSTDKTNEIIKQFEKKDERIKTITQKNEGAGSARNKGIEIATGEFIKFVDADDYLNRDTLQKMYEAAINNDATLVRGNSTTLIGPFKGNDFCNWGDIKEQRIILPREEKNIIVTEFPNIGNKLFRRDLLEKIRFPEKLKWEDLGIVPALMANSEKIYDMNEPIYNYRIHMNTTVKDFLFKIKNVLDIIRILEYLETILKESKLSEEYKSQMESMYILHTLYRAENAMFWINISKEQKKQIIGSLINIIELKYPNWRNNKMVEQYMKVNPLFNFDMKRLDKFTKEYKPINSQEEAEQNIQKILLSKSTK